MGGDPLGGSQGALQRRAGALHGVVEVLRGGEEVLRDVVWVLLGACLVEGAQSVVQPQAPVPVLGPGQLQQQPRLPLAAPSAASPSFRRI